MRRPTCSSSMQVLACGGERKEMHCSTQTVVGHAWLDPSVGQLLACGTWPTGNMSTN